MFLHVAVQRLTSGETQELIELTRRLGGLHANLRHVRFDAEYWLLFKNVLLTQLQTPCLLGTVIIVLFFVIFAP